MIVLTQKKRKKEGREHIGIKIQKFEERRTLSERKVFNVANE